MDVNRFRTLLHTRFNPGSSHLVQRYKIKSFLFAESNKSSFYLLRGAKG
jgi:hypothetical protein